MAVPFDRITVLIFLVYRMPHTKKYLKSFIQQNVSIISLQAPGGVAFQIRNKKEKKEKKKKKKKKKRKPFCSKLSREQ